MNRAQNLIENAKLPPSLQRCLSDRPEGSFAIYADGAVSKKHGTIGIGVVVEDPFGFVIAELATRPEVFEERLRDDLKLDERGPLTSNHAELFGLHIALSIAVNVTAGTPIFPNALTPQVEAWSVHIVSDSSYALGIVTGAFTPSTNQWLVDPIRNRLTALRNAGVSVTFGHVRGHQGHPQNERCDTLADRAKKTDVSQLPWLWSPWPTKDQPILAIARAIRRWRTCLDILHRTTNTQLVLDQLVVSFGDFAKRSSVPHPVPGGRLCYRVEFSEHTAEYFVEALPRWATMIGKLRGTNIAYTGTGPGEVEVFASLRPLPLLGVDVYAIVVTESIDAMDCVRGVCLAAASWTAAAFDGQEDAGLVLAGVQP